jgi:aminoglycoside phosphotransferase (APT) family kinase protein
VTLAAYAAVLAVDEQRLTLRSGQRNDVVLDRQAGIAWRFPRTLQALGTLELSAARTTAATARALPAPEVLAVVAAPLGSARIGLRLVGGVGLSPALTAALSPPSRERLVADLVTLLGGLRNASGVGWPGDPLPWAVRWAALGDRLTREVVPLLQVAQDAERATAVVGRAVDAACDAGVAGIAHGDLGGENVHLDPLTGALVGVLDWDDAAPGDPALDLAALRAHAEPWLTAALLEEDPSLAALHARADAYLATFPLQEALWGLDSGDDQAVTRGLAPYRSTSPSADGWDSRSGSGSS